MEKEARLSRRALLLTAGATAGAASVTVPAEAALFPGLRPKVAIVGGGVAGLNAAYRLRQAGIRATVYEAADRFGGRIRTARGLLAPDLTTELGGEFIDSGHREMRRLAREFDLRLLDTQSAEERPFAETYYFNGQHYSEADVVEEFAPVALRLKRTINRLSNSITFRNSSPFDKAHDHVSIREYLNSIEVSGWLRAFLDVAYVTEYGRETGDQSAINLLFLIGTRAEVGRFSIFGVSDERYKVEGGNQQIIRGLVNRLDGQLRLGYRLEALREQGRGYRLTFQTDGGPQEVDADFVILTLPFTLLRQVDLQAELPLWKRRAIQQLGYGDNAKVMLGFERRSWREQNLNGEAFSDEAFQLCWDNSRLQNSTSGGITLYSGGLAAGEVGEGTPEEQAQQLLPGLEAVFPGISASRNGTAARAHWPSEPFTQASYACYLPGQWTTIAGAEALPVGKLLFAGEHTSLDFQGYMNGGAQSGRDAAQLLLRRVGRSFPF